MVHVMKSLKMLALSLECSIAGKPLPAKELFVVRIVKALYNAVAPGLSNRNEHRLDAA